VYNNNDNGVSFLGKMKIIKQIGSIFLVLLYAIGAFSFSLTLQNSNNVEANNKVNISCEKNDSTPDEQPSQNDVIIPDGNKVVWRQAYLNYVAEQQALDANYVYSLVGNGSENNPYQISNVLDLNHFLYTVQYNSAFPKGKYFELTNDIVLNDGYFEEDGTYHDGGDGELYSWEWSISLNGNTTQKIFFDGKKHAVIGLYKMSLFAGFTCVEFKNLTVKNSYVSGSKAIVSSGSASSSLFENIVCYGTVYRESGEASGIFGQTSDSNIIGCKNYANVTTLSGRACGIADTVLGQVIIKNCENHGTINGTGNCCGIFYNSSRISVENCKNFGDVTSSIGAFGVTNTIGSEGKLTRCMNYGNLKAQSYVGGILRGGQCVISYCVNYGNLLRSSDSSGDDFGGICAGYQFSGYRSFIDNCVNYGTIEGRNYVGGIYGCAWNTDNQSSFIEITNCKNYGKIQGNGEVGGILGSIRITTSNSDFRGVIRSCENYGLISHHGAGGGGICGEVNGYVKECLFQNCVNKGFISGSSASGGILGKTDGNGNLFTYFEYCSNFGNIVCSLYYVGGIVGFSRSVKTIYHCQNEGRIKGSFSGTQGVAGLVCGIVSKVICSCNKGKVINNYSNKSPAGLVYGYGEFTNCYNFGDLSGAGNELSSNASSVITNCIIDCKSGNTPKKLFYGDDFSAFYVNGGTGAIGLKTLDCVGAYMPMSLTEQYLSGHSYQKIS